MLLFRPSKRTAITMSALLLLFAIGLVMPAFVSRAVLQDLIFILTMLTLAQLWNLIAGFGGMVSVGQQAFVGIGAYALFAAVILGAWNPIPALLLGGFAAAALAVPMAFFAFRLQGAYFAIGTWVVAEIVRLLAAQWMPLGGGTGTALPRDAILGTWGVANLSASTGLRATAARDVITYWLALALALGTLAGAFLLLRSRIGLALAAIRDNDGVAEAMGVHARGIKWLVFVSTAFVTGLVGALIFLQTARISPDAAFSLTNWTAYVIFIVVIGGIGRLEGPILGILVFWGLQTLLAQYGSWYLLTLGAFAIAVMLFEPRGLWGLMSRLVRHDIFQVQRRL